MNQASIERAFRDACLAELQALKPGNVHIHAAGHGMTVEDFERSAEVAAPRIAQAGATVGQRVLAAVRSTVACVGCNTNLGILLLAAPLAVAAENCRGRTLRDTLEDVLSGLTVADADRAFAAIRIADPGGLGAVPQNDVRQPAEVTLIEAMRQAADRDLVARQYATSYRDVFEFCEPRYRIGADGGHEPWEVTSLYLRLLAALPDSHIGRKFGPAVAEAVRVRAESLVAAGQTVAGAAPELAAFDEDLKRAGLNPGSIADLTVATLFAAGLER